MQTAALEGRVALVTGASRGIGGAIAARLALAGARVAVNYRERAAEAEQVVAAITARGQTAVAFGADVSVSAQVSRLHEAVRAQLGPVDILINNAGRGTVRTIETIDEVEFDRTLAVNLKSAFLCTQAVLPDMRARRWGRIVNVASIAARTGGSVGVHYTASKAGLEGMTRYYASQVAREGVTVNTISPGLTDTEMADGIKEQVAPRIPVGRLATPDEIAQAVELLVSNGFITGQSLHINGGSYFA